MTTFIPFRTHLTEALKDPETKAEWERTRSAHEISISLLRWRADHDLTQKQAGEYLQVPPNTIARWERGEVRVARDHWVRLALEHYDCLQKGSK